MTGSTLTEEGRNKLCNLLQRNLDTFTWKPVDMTGVPRHIAEHHLDVREGCSLVRQKKRSVPQKDWQKSGSVRGRPGHQKPRTEDTRKLGPKWEGPYEVTEALGKGAYKLRDRDGKQLPRTWNVSNLKKCYIHKM
ncbi:hypothetical protein Tco_0137666 [Tanacetum coccineum]